MKEWLKFVKFLMAIQFMAVISCNVDATDDPLNNDQSSPGYAQVRIQNDTLGYYRFDTAKINNVDFGSIESGSTSQYIQISSDQNISVSISMYNEVQKKTEGTATQSDWQLTGRFKKNIYHNFQLYFDSASLKVKLNISESMAVENEPVYLTLNQPQVIIHNDSTIFRLENVTINNISFGTVDNQQKSAALDVPAIQPIALSVDIYQSNDNVYAGKATETTWNITGNFLKGKIYTMRFYYYSSTNKVLQETTNIDQ
jgi:hypothetical protein